MKKSPGRIAYEAFRSVTENLSPRDDWWSSQSPIDQKRWEAAAMAVSSTLPIEKQTLPQDLADGACWGMFSRGDSYQVIPRVILCGMPREWQEKFVALFEQIEEVFDTSNLPGTYTVQLRDETGRFIKDWMTNYRNMGINQLPYLKK